MAFNISQLQSSNTKKEAGTHSTKNKGHCKEKLAYLGHGAQRQHNQLEVLETELLNIAAVLYIGSGCALSQQDRRDEREKPEDRLRV